jgi:hypothetical protein
MINVRTDELIDAYLRRLDAAAAVLPADRRAELVSEIRSHLREAMDDRATGDDELAVRNVLERLGSPEEIVSEASDSVPAPAIVPVREMNGLAVASPLFAVLWLFGIGAVLAIILGFRARWEIKRSNGRQRGRSLALVGIILGFIGLAVVLIGALGVVVGSETGGPVPVHTR